ncbi:MFS transporter [Brevibacterium aurantiacum]|nr:MFS transporter [Brevibacterium aurantiacum]
MADSEAARKSAKESRRASLGSYVGATLEWYDFSIYATASALIFPAVFFSDVDQGLGAVLSYVTLAGGYIARPLGAILFGHFGDRLGRRRMLILTILLMGIASIGIGVVPSSATLGHWSAVLLVALRLLQGIAVGGEWAGASLMSIEHAKENRKGVAGAIVQTGGPSGTLLATGVFSLVTLMAHDQVVAWAWRIPFLLSAIVVIIAIIIRLGVSESPEFLAIQQSAPAPVKQRAPIVTTFTENWLSVVLIILTALAPFFIQSLSATFALQFAVDHGNAESSTLSMLTIANFFAILSTIGAAVLSDRYSRLGVMATGFVVSGVFIWVAFALFSVTNLWAVLLGFVILLPLGNGLVTGPLAAYMASMFPVHNRFTGVGISYQLAATVSAGSAPLVATGLMSAGDGDTVLLTLLVSVLSAVGLTTVILSRKVHST